MKKFFLLMIAAACGTHSWGQNINPDNDYAPGRGMHSRACMRDSVATGWCIDANLTGGFLMQNITTTNLAANYADALNTNIAGVQYKNGVSMGVDLQAGYFFGPCRHFGVGVGVMYMNQQGDLTIDRFHVEYKSLDYYGNTFRQMLTSNGQIKESVNTSNLNIPVVFKYKTFFSHKIGFTADAGLLINVLEQNNYNTKASFDYEAVYKYSGSEGSVVPVYDNSPTPAPSDLIIARNQYPNTSYASVQQYFNSLRANNYNVGLGVAPNQKTGSVSYTTPSVGIILHPALNIWLSNNFSLNLGVYYIYQNFSNNTPANYQITDKVGSYNPILNSVTNSVNNNIGFDAGLRYCFTRHRAPEPVPAPEPEEAPAAPVEEAPVASPVNEDDMQEPMSISTPILFKLNQSKIQPVYYPVLDEAIREMSENKHSMLVINGYTDITGTASYNRALSRKRAGAVKSYLHKKGVKTRQMKAVGHGAKDPAASNSTPEGRALNRRVELKVKPMHEEE